jgi:hypothetical protein
MAMESGVDAAIVEHLKKNYPPEAVAPVVAFLAHESCTLNGETFGASGGTAAQWLIGENAPYAPATLTPEGVRDHLGTICDRTTFTPYPSTMAHVNRGRGYGSRLIHDCSAVSDDYLT